MTATLSPLAFETLATLLKTKSGLIIGIDKLYLLETRLAAIVKREKLADLNGWQSVCDALAATRWRARWLRQ
jgi:chemotaxis protein methyltransferase CheR